MEMHLVCQRISLVSIPFVLLSSPLPVLSCACYKASTS
jgi:hypothetical protein